MIFTNENVAAGLPRADRFQVGISDVDQLNQPEVGLNIPWMVSKEFSFITYQCWIEAELDSGIVIHRPLPQSIQEADTLAAGDVYGGKFFEFTGGLNLNSHGSFENFIQRMATSEYRFCLKGYAMRVGYQISFPKLVTIGGQIAVPDDRKPQRTVGPILVSNNSGVPVYFASWAFWYTLLKPPTGDAVPPPNLAEHIKATDPVPDGIQMPISITDPNATRSLQPTMNLPTAIPAGDG